MYFMLIRPQKKKEKEVTAMRAGLKVGDHIVTIGGICGKIVKVKDETIVIAVGADKVKMELMKWAVSQVTSKTKEEKSSKPKKLGKKDETVVDVALEPAVEKVEEKAEAVEAAESVAEEAK
jgi:preprotein translocase subunit YajC